MIRLILDDFIAVNRKLFRCRPKPGIGAKLKQAQSLKKLGIIWKKESELLKTWTKINRSFFSQRKDNP